MNSNVKDPLQHEWRKWVATALAVSIIMSLLIGLGEAYLWSDYIKYTIGVLIGSLLSFSNIFLAYLSRKKAEITYVLFCIVSLLVATFLAQASLELKSTEIGTITGLIIANILLFFPIILGLFLASTEPIRKSDLIIEREK